MMKTEIDMVNDVYSLINKPEVKALIDGVIIKYQRPKGSKKKDIVVGSLTLGNRTLQAGMCNIHIHAPNLQNVKFDGITDDQQPDLASLNAISAAIYPLLEARWMDGYHTDFDSASKPYQEPDGTWRVTLRINYYATTNEFKNI